jgi:mercuric ion transport protein
MGRRRRLRAIRIKKEGSVVMADKTSKAGKTDGMLLRTGVIGSVVLALCCFTPVLVVLLGIVGLSALTGWLDLVLLPALAVFVGLTVYAVWRRQRRMKNP